MNETQGGSGLAILPLIEVETVSKTFSTADGELPVLDSISLSVHAGEVVALLGKSGSGKSTLLRCIAGLIVPSSGSVRFCGDVLNGTNPGTAMVFQSFALLPWLTVLQNVELGLEAKGVEPAHRRELAERAIDLIGLDGFESAYPKELSGGMRQRVGFARALVVEPQVLLMDEPFSALDVLTAENLRGELMELWDSDEFPIQAILLVTHNIEEAVLLADRVLILGTNPGRLKLEMAIPLPRPRNRHGAEFQALVDRIYAVMTGQPAPETDDKPAVLATPATVPLPNASVDSLSGLAEILAGLGAVSIGETASELGFEVDDLLPLVEEARWIRYAQDHLRHLFPYVPGQAGYNKRLRKSAGQLEALIRLLGEDTDVWHDDVWLIDSTPVECTRSRPAAQRSNIAGWAGYGYRASHSRYFWGSPVASRVHPDGVTGRVRVDEPETR